MKAPKAKQVPYQHELHGDVRQDEYYWLRDKTNPDVIAYLEAENQFYEESMKPLAPLAERLFQAMVDRIPSVEERVPVQHGPYYYYTRLEKDLQYPIFARKRAENRDALARATEEILLDQNQMVADGEYLSVTVQRISPDHSRLAYLENHDGTDRYTAHVKDLDTGELLSEQIDNVFIAGSLEWDESGETLFYLTVDETQRPDRLWRHRVGDTTADELIYQEDDTTYTLSIHKSRSGKYLFLESQNKETTEVRFVSAESPQSKWQLFAPRRRGIQYELEHWQDKFLILTNEGAANFRVLHCPEGSTALAGDTATEGDATPDGNTVEGTLLELFPYDENRYIEAIYPFQDAIVVEGRQDGLAAVYVFRETTLHQLSFDESLYTVSVWANYSYETTELLLQYESLLTPRTIYSFDLGSETLTCLQVAEVPGEFHPDDYIQERLFATAPDGVQVPMFAVYRKDSLNHGPAPLILYGYGSYGMNSDPHFDAMRLPLLDAGVVLVTAQVRGGSEMGKQWYDDGKFLKKRNTFTDFVAVAEDLIRRGYTTPAQLAGQGASAGGLLMGAVANLAGDLFTVLLPGVPFVDVVTTILDESLPLTTLEWDEWGNPNDPEYYDYMKSYSPYDNVEGKSYPHMLVTTGLNDPRVAYWEPAKWVARLRATKTDNHTILLKTNMGAGHFGSSGRINRLKEVASQFAFALSYIGATVR